MATRVSDIVVRIGADVAGLRRGADQAVASTQRIERQVKQVTSALKALAGAFVIRQIGQFVTSSLQAVDAQAKLARRLESTIDGLRAYQLAAGYAGASTEEANTAADKLNVKLGEIARGAAAPTAALRELGLQLSDLVGMDTDERMAAIADRIAAMGLSSSQTADILRRLGIESRSMVGLMMQGGDAIRAAREEVDRFGLSISEVDAARIEAANDALARVGLVMEGVRNQVAIGVAPALQLVAEQITDVASRHGGWAEIAARATQSIVRGVGYILQALGGLVNFIEGNPATSGLGLLGKLMFGTKGMIAFGAVGALVDQFIKSELESVESEIIRLARMRDTLLDERLIRRMDSPAPFARNFMFAGLDLPEIERQIGDLNDQILELQRRRDALVQDGAGRSGIGDMMQDVGESLSSLDFSALGEIPALAAPAFPVLQDLSDLLDGIAGPEKTDAYLAELQRRLDGVRSFLEQEAFDQLSAIEQEEVRHAERLAVLNEAQAAELVSRQEHAAAVEALEEAHQRALADIRRMAALTAVGDVASMLGSIGAALESGGEKNFKIAKAFKIAEALVNAGAAIMQTWADPSIPFWGKIAATAAVAARTMATISQMKAVQPGSGGAVTGGGGGGGAAQASQPHQLYISGLNPSQLYSGGAVAQIIDEINRLQKDGKTVDIVHRRAA